ncbi:MAG: hypothetical protein R2873_35845 [Caldilineaceae bacterium]
METIEAYVELTDETLAYIEDLLMVYAELYGANSEEMILILQKSEQDHKEVIAASNVIAPRWKRSPTHWAQIWPWPKKTIAQLENAAANAASVADLSVDSGRLMSNLYQPVGELAAKRPKM